MRGGADVLAVTDSCAVSPMIAAYLRSLSLSLSLSLSHTHTQSLSLSLSLSLSDTHTNTHTGQEGGKYVRARAEGDAANRRSR